MGGWKRLARTVIAELEGRLVREFMILRQEQGGMLSMSANRRRRPAPPQLRVFRFVYNGTRDKRKDSR